MPRRLIPLLAAAVIAVVGLAGLIYGVLLATALASPTQTIGRVSGVSGVPVLATATGVLDLDGPRVEVQATAPSNGPVFLGIARADDVTAYLADTSRAEITRVADDGQLTIVRAGARASLPNPAEADIWVMSTSATGTASLVWPDTVGPWRLVVAGDGTTGMPQQVSLAWSRAPRSTSAPALITVGVLLLVGGLLGLLVLRGRGWGIGEDDESDSVGRGDDEDDGERQDAPAKGLGGSSPGDAGPGGAGPGDAGPRLGSDDPEVSA